MSDFCWRFFFLPLCHWLEVQVYNAGVFTVLFCSYVFPLPNRAVLTFLSALRLSLLRFYFSNELGTQQNKPSFSPLLNILHYSPPSQSLPTNPLRIGNTGALNWAFCLAARVLNMICILISQMKRRRFKRRTTAAVGGSRRVVTPALPSVKVTESRSLLKRAEAYFVPRLSCASLNESIFGKKKKKSRLR